MLLILSILATSWLLHVLFTILSHSSVLESILKLLLNWHNLLVEGLILPVVDTAHHLVIDTRVASLTVRNSRLASTNVDLVLSNLLLLLPDD